MKILTGRFKGRLIEFKVQPGLRPTADKVRKAVIDVFAGWVEGKRVLDLFSGTGAFGFELLSAGAAEVWFVEKDPQRAKTIERWLQAVRAESNCEVMTADAHKIIDLLRGEEKRFDLAIMDPPYEEPLKKDFLERIHQLISPEGYVVYECREANDPPEFLGFEKVRDKVYGDTRLAVYRLKK